eukprot:453085-Pleurochrysis_carterae.AAC.1
MDTVEAGTTIVGGGELAGCLRGQSEQNGEATPLFQTPTGLVDKAQLLLNDGVDSRVRSYQRRISMQN